MFVKYFIPEDGDEQAHPNVFRLDAAQPTLTEVKRVRRLFLLRSFFLTHIVSIVISGFSRARLISFPVSEEYWLTYCVA